MKLFKLTDQDGYTRRGEPGETQWYPGFTLSLPKTKNPKLCTPKVIHAYNNLNLALLLNPNHANITNPVAWSAKGRVCCRDWGKVGTFSLTTISRISIPCWYPDINIRKRVQVMFAILCAESVIHYFEGQIPSDDRPRKAIEAAKEYLKNPTTDAAYAAARAADAAAYAAYAARAADYATDAAYAAAYAARAADYATDAAYAAYAAADAAARAADIDFGQLADGAVAFIEEGKG